MADSTTTPTNIPLTDTMVPLDTSQTVSLFMIDPVFTNRNSGYHTLLDAGGVCRFSQTGLSYFSKPEAVDSPIKATDRKVSWVADTTPSLFVDKTAYSQFVSDMESISIPIKTTLFQLLDQVFFSSQTIADLETLLTTTAPFNTLYVPKSLYSTASLISSTYYQAGVGTTLNVYPYLSFSVQLPYPTAQNPTQYDLTVYINDADWIKNYPISLIEAVAPPLPYADLLTANLQTATDNEFTIAKKISDTYFSTIGAADNARPNSGEIVYTSTIVDPTNSSLFLAVPFIVSYKGAQPSISQMREAIKQAILASGVGTITQWQNRLPDLFITQRFYLVPIWDNTVKQGDRILNKGIISPSDTLTKLAYIFPSMSRGDITKLVEYLTATYGEMVIASVPDVNTAYQGKLNALYSTYQPISTTDPAFQYMDTPTQNFAKSLNTILPISGGVTQDPNVVLVTDRGISYYSFTLGSAELCVVTKDCYTSILASVANNG